MRCPRSSFPAISASRPARIARNRARMRPGARPGCPQGRRHPGPHLGFGVAGAPTVPGGDSRQARDTPASWRCTGSTTASRRPSPGVAAAPAGGFPPGAHRNRHVDPDAVAGGAAHTDGQRACGETATRPARHHRDAWPGNPEVPGPGRPQPLWRSDGTQATVAHSRAPSRTAAVAPRMIPRRFKEFILNVAEALGYSPARGFRFPYRRPVGHRELRIVARKRGPEGPRQGLM